MDVKVQGARAGHKSVAQDVGVDKAFLLSESGFQAGAISAARSTNILLSDLQMLEEMAAKK
jgi:restriction system protein